MRALVIAWVMAVAVTAHAAPEPWAADVRASDQERANALFADANVLFAQQAYGPAAEKYRAALALWDHPVIRFNLVVTLFKLERFVDAADALDAALRWGNAPFTPEQLAQIAEYQTKLRDLVGELSVTCSTEGTQVLLDGKEWFACPATRKQRVLAGEHVVVADTSAERVTVTPGTTVSTTVTTGALERTVPRWHPRVPWTIAISGGVVASVTTLLVWRSSVRYDELEEQRLCECTDKTVYELTNAQNHEQRFAKWMTVPFVIGAAALGTGIVMLLVNRKTTRVPAIEVQTGNGGAVATASWRL